MAKLNVTVPAVDVEVNGVKYRKVDRDAQVGDIIRYMDDESSYVTTGAFYEVTRIDEFGDPQIVDNDGDEHDLCGEEFEVYTKVAEPTAEYREVKRWAEPGERIRIVRKYSGEERYENGAEFVVDSVDGDGDVRVTVESWGRVMVMLCEYVVLEPVTTGESATKRLTVGDYAKVIANSTIHNYTIGSFVKIVRDDEDHQPYRAEKADGTEGNFLAEKDVEPATEAEFLAQNRLKVGEFAKVVAKNRMFTDEHVSVGDVVKITEDDDSSRPFNTDTIDGKNAGWFTESELVRATDEEVAQAKRKLAAETTTDPRSQFAKGEKVRLVSGGGKYPLNGYDNGEIYEVATPLYNTHHEGAVVEIVGGSIPVGYAKPEQLAKLTIEVGSTVRLTIKDGEKPEHGWGDVSNGAIGTVTHINGNSARVEFPAQPRWHALLSELTLVSDAEKAQPQPEPVRFKVGEYARSLVAKAGMPTGSIVKVVRDDEDFSPFKSTLLDGSAYHYYTQDELERVDAETAKWASIGRKVDEIRRGDIVEVTIGYGEIKRGDIGEITDADGSVCPGVTVRGVQRYVAVKLITPIEQRFDRMELEATKAAA
ncbi:hypothetical protein J2W97_000819 [Paenibacillus jamilae]|jgi:hypothetical protein|uniref:hypothetical protein n=1 Tax=Paenibacillus polymyxa TaxID=1406 RepID=UPI0015801C34|nr:hypothetical protein [Paenibacillus polymyxa]MDP9674836.1 hypothetical protein [Paenibacillus jamilae]MBY0023795.1 hypothetical protein [Paenibacillus polymyxa]MBY0056467.1 hypothetical protein [Paenibacillus polymyxa]MBY0071814.1 hypothetical protein [Paenibacillus polymyxa]MBY0080620.1 hypothetical protein [Paenibacillus polymyxa]